MTEASRSPATANAMDKADASMGAAASRDQFLLELYRQTSNHLDRHILVVWQSMGMLIGAIAILALVEKHVVTIDIAATLINLICVWAAFHVSDASLWFNRNLLMIANVERQFLLPADSKEIHYFFMAHRKGTMVSHFRIQIGLAIGLGFVVLTWHFIERVIPGFSLPLAWSSIELVRWLPYLVAAIGTAIWSCFHRGNMREYAKLRKRSPGRLIV